MPASATLRANRLCAALFAVMALPAVAQDTANQAPDGVDTLDRIAVTGTRIKRSEAEESLPITAITREKIDQLGITSAEQLLMTLNISGNGSDNLASNAGIVNEEQRGNNGVSGANLRGQGDPEFDLAVALGEDAAAELVVLALGRQALAGDVPAFVDDVDDLAAGQVEHAVGAHFVVAQFVDDGDGELEIHGGIRRSGPTL